MIFNIQRFSTHDGKGIRTIIFFKGCPLRCRWCSNPESQNLQPEIFFDPKRCILCCECVKYSKNKEFTCENGKLEFSRELVNDAGLFRDICPSKAIEVTGNETSVEEIVKEVLKDLPFYDRSEGGVTLSGGEPFFQPVLVERITKELKKLKINIAVETCLDIPWKNIERSAPEIDVFLADLKHVDPLKYKAFTNGNLDQVLSNFRNLEAAGIEVIARIPVIQGFNAAEEEMHSIIDFAAGLKNVHKVNFLPYHTFGTGKYTLLGRIYDFENRSVDDSFINHFADYAKNLGLNASMGG